MEPLPDFLEDITWARSAAESYRSHFTQISAYCMFIGYPRSGHSLCGALLNAHPAIVISHELNALFYIARGIGRDELFSLIIRRDRWFAERGNTWSGYDYTVPRQWQGRFQQLRVIGDKKGGASTKLLKASPEILLTLRSVVQVPIRLIHIVRNPFDNISRMALTDRLSLETSISNYFELVETNARLLVQADPLEVITQRHEDLVAQPEKQVRQLLEFVGLPGADSHSADCAGIVHKKPRKSRLEIEWNNHQIETVLAELCKYPFLRGYTFTD